jgi:VWFA-related protein
MRLVTAPIIVILAGTLAAGAPVRQAHGVDRVVINAIVLDAKGSPVTDLTRGDFDVRVDGQPRQVAAVSAAAAPSMVVLLDSTLSTHWTIRSASYVQVIERFVAALAPTDRVRMGVIARTLRLSKAPTSDRRQLVRDTQELLVLPEEDRQGPSPIWDATLVAVETLATESGQRAVVLVTDGRASGNVTGLREVAIHAISAGVSVSSVTACEERVMIGQTRTTAASVAPGRQLAWLAGMTGGLCAQLWRTLDTEAALVRGLQSWLQALRRAYALEIPLQPNDGPSPAVTVAVIRQGLTVHARNGFVSKPPQ